MLVMDFSLASFNRDPPGERECKLHHSDALPWRVAVKRGVYSSRILR